MNNCAVFINSCDNRSYTWKGMDYFFGAHWNFDIGWDVYFGTENTPVDFKWAKNLRLGKCPWGEFVLKACNEIPEDYIFWFMDDHYPRLTPETELLQDALDFCIAGAKRFGFYQVYHDMQEPFQELGDFHGYPFYQLTRESDYLSCFQPGIWDKKFLMSVIEPGWSPWNGEINGTEKIRTFTDEPLIYYINKAGWYKEAYTGTGRRRDESLADWNGVPLDDWKTLKEEYDWE